MGGVNDFLLRHFFVELHSNLLEEGEDLSRAEDAPGKNVRHDLGRLGNVIWLATRAPWLASPTWNTTASTVSRLYPSPWMNARNSLTSKAPMRRLKMTSLRLFCVTSRKFSGPLLKYVGSMTKSFPC